jgi:hypothetical protein
VKIYGAVKLFAVTRCAAPRRALAKFGIDGHEKLPSGTDGSDVGMWGHE